MSGKKTPAPVMELALEELEAILERAQVGAISLEEYTQLKALIYTFALLQEGKDSGNPVLAPVFMNV